MQSSSKVKISGGSPVNWREMVRVERNKPVRSRKSWTRSSGGKNPTRLSVSYDALVLSRMIEKSNHMLHLIIVLFICERGPPVSTLKCYGAEPVDRYGCLVWERIIVV